MLDTIVSPAGMAGVRSVGQRRLKDRCELVSARETKSASGGAGPKTYQVVGQMACDVVARNQTGSVNSGENQNREIGLYDLHLPLGTAVNLASRIYIPAFIPEWRPGVSYSAGAYVCKPDGFGDGFFYICMESGTSGWEVPFNDLSVIGHPVVDGTIGSPQKAVWRNAGALIILEAVADEIANRSNAGSMVVVCKVVT